MADLRIVDTPESVDLRSRMPSPPHQYDEREAFEVCKNEREAEDSEDWRSENQLCLAPVKQLAVTIGSQETWEMMGNGSDCSHQDDDEFSLLLERLFCEYDQQERRSQKEREVPVSPNNPTLTTRAEPFRCGAHHFTLR